MRQIVPYQEQNTNNETYSKYYANDHFPSLSINGFSDNAQTRISKFHTETDRSEGVRAGTEGKSRE